MMEFVSDNDRFDARALARLTAISDLLDHYLRTGEVEHPGMFLFNATGTSGAEVHVMGISHVEFGPWGIRREYTLFDETAIWKQIAMKTG